MESWFSDTKPITSLETEVCFLLQEEFYYGPDTHSDIESLRFIEPLTLPDIPRKEPSMLRTQELIGHEEQLATYYKQIVQIGRRSQKPFSAISHYFWLRFWIWNSADQIYIPFPWYDTFSEIDRLLTSISDTQSGEVYYDRDQSWELEIQAHDDILYFRLRDPDDDEDHVLVSVARPALLSQIEPLRENTVQIINRLAAFLGADVWTQRVAAPSFYVQTPSLGKKRPGWKFW
jgi:hypothetical protein